MSDDNSATKAALRTLRSNAFKLQSMLRRAAAGKDSPTILNKASSVILNHFTRVESLNIDIPEKNKREHVSLLKQSMQIEADWRKGKVSDADYADALNLMLTNHFLMRLQPLLNLHLEEDFILNFDDQSPLEP